MNGDVPLRAAAMRINLLANQGAADANWHERTGFGNGGVLLPAQALLGISRTFTARAVLRFC